MNQYEDQQALSEEEGPQFNNLVVDKNTGRVYIGAVNKLYQLSPNLEPMVNISNELLTIVKSGMRNHFYILLESCCVEPNIEIQNVSLPSAPL